jgi:hypothetical protein
MKILGVLLFRRVLMMIYDQNTMRGQKTKYVLFSIGYSKLPVSPNPC